jgi:outer membrane lipoprotein carrier protein
VNLLLLVLAIDAGTPAPAPAAAAPAPAAAPAAHAMTPEVKSLVDRMQAFYEKTQDFSADFKQDYTYKAFKRTTTSTGKMVFKKPAATRWDYDKPAGKAFVLKDDKVYALDPDALTLTVSQLSTDKLSAAVTFLWGKGKLENEFNISKLDCKDCKGTQLELVPKVPDPRFQKVKLEVDPEKATVLRSTVIDPDGSENAITFSNTKTNTSVEDKAFVVKPPPGTKVVDFTKAPPK